MALGLVGKLTVMFGADFQGFDKAMKKAEKNLSKFGQKMQQTGMGLTTSVTLPVLGLGAAAVKMASDFDEALNKVRVSFGNASGFVEKFAKTTLDSFGIAEGSALDMAALFGDMGTSIGLSQSAAAQMSTTLVGLVGDLASFKNIRHDIAQTALASVFTGETESLKKLGVIMTQANLQQFALEQGITKTIKQMSEAEKVQLRFNFVLARTTNAQGDYLRTNLGVANSLRDLQQRFQELGEQVGQILTPFAEKLIQKLKSLIDTFRNLSTEQKENIIRFAAIAATVGPLLIVIGKLSVGIVAVARAISMTTKALGFLRVAILTSPIGALITALSAGIGLLILNLGQMDIATKKTKTLSDDLIKTKERLATLNEDELKTEKAKLQIQLKNIDIKLKAAKEAIRLKSENINVGGVTLQGPDMGDTNEGTSASAFQLQEQKDEVISLTNEFNKLKSILKDIDSLLIDNNTNIKDLNSNTNDLVISFEDLEKFKPLENMSSISDQFAEEMSLVNEQFEDIVINMEDFNAKLRESNALNQLFGDILFNSMMSASNSQEGFFSSFIENIKKAIKQLIIQLAVLTAINLLLGGPNVAGNLAKAFSLAKSSILALANGGLVTGPTMALVGEGAGTSASNPEVVAPLDRLKGMINGGGTQQVEVFGRISGNDIFISNQRGGMSRLRSV